MAHSTKLQLSLIPGLSAKISSKERIFGGDHLGKSLHSHGIEVIDFANVANHLHLIIKIRSRRRYNRVIRAFSASVSRLVTGANN